MSSTIGNRVRLSIFGESHGEAIGCVLDGLPAGEALDMEEIRVQMARRAPGRDKTATTRLESDIPAILSGTLNGRTTGATSGTTGITTCGAAAMSVADSPPPWCSPGPSAAKSCAGGG